MTSDADRPFLVDVELDAGQLELCRELTAFGLELVDAAAGEPPDQVSRADVEQTLERRRREMQLADAALTGAGPAFAFTMGDLALLVELAGWLRESAEHNADRVPDGLDALEAHLTAIHRAALPAAGAHFEAQLRRRVRSEQPQVIAVGAGQHTAQFAYTAGLWLRFGHPEIIAVGLPAQPAHQLLNVLIEKVRSGQRLEPGLTFQVEWMDFTFALAGPADAGRAGEWIRMAPDDDAGRPAPALQLVWPDAEDRLPWQDGYSMPADAQPPIAGTWTS